MKKWNAIGIFFMLLLAMIFVSGCTKTASPGTVPVAPSAQQTIPGTGPVTSAPLTVARYSVGDIVWNDDSNYDTELHRSRGMIITRVSPQSYTYQYVSKNDGDALWSQFYPNEEIENIQVFEKTYTRKVDHVLSVTSQYPSRAAFEDAISKESCCPSPTGAGAACLQPSATSTPRCR